MGVLGHAERLLSRHFGISADIDVAKSDI